MASMSILDDAIREHLELKRAHGADDAEVKRLEDEAFGPPQRPDEPDPYADAPTEMFDVEAQFEDAATEADAPSDEQLIDAELAEPRLAPVDPLAGIEAD